MCGLCDELCAYESVFGQCLNVEYKYYVFRFGVFSEV